MTDALIIPEGALLPGQVHAQVQLIQQLMRDVMKDGEHYGTIPGCGDKKVLMKSGAEKLCFAFQLVPTFEITLREHANGHREYETKCRISNRAGVLIAEGVGTCSTLEPKYRYRNAARKCPACGKEAIIKGKEEYGGGWLCWKKKDGCGAQWAIGAKEIESQEAGKVENPDPAEQYNTVLKISKKRAHVDGVITAVAASDLLTQDLEEGAELAKPEESAPQGNADAPQRETKAAAAPSSPKTTAAAPKPEAKKNGTPTAGHAQDTSEPTAGELRASKARFDEVIHKLPDGTFASKEQQAAITAAYKLAEAASSRDEALDCIRHVAGERAAAPKDVPSHKVAALLTALADLVKIAAAFKRASGATSEDEAGECLLVVAGETKLGRIPADKTMTVINALDQLAGIEVEH